MYEGYDANTHKKTQYKKTYPSIVVLLEKNGELFFLSDIKQRIESNVPVSTHTVFDRDVVDKQVVIVSPELSFLLS